MQWYSKVMHSSNRTENSPLKLIDSFGRQISYLRLSVTDRCNLRCTYCMAEDMTFMPKSKVLTIEEMVSVAKAFVELGVKKIRLTGGEPLVRNGLVELVQEINRIDGLNELVITTNGVLLDEFAQPLKDAGVSRVNISIDSLREERFKSLTRFGKLADVLRGIDCAKQAGFENIKLNSVILKGENDDEVLPLVKFAVSKSLDISFIEEMPLGEINSHNRSATALTSDNIKRALQQDFDLTYSDNVDPTSGPSRYFQLANTKTRVGFISPMSNNFCSSCNRVRVTASGKLLLCLGNENALDLRRIIRNQNADLKASIINAIKHKPEKHDFDPKEIKIRRHMSVTGG